MTSENRMRTCLDCRATLPYQKCGRKRLRCYRCCADRNRARSRAYQATKRQLTRRRYRPVPGDLCPAEIERRIVAHLAQLKRERAA